MVLIAIQWIVAIVSIKHDKEYLEKTGIPHRNSPNYQEAHIKIYWGKWSVKFTAQIAWIQTFTTFLTLTWELLDVGIITNVSF